MFTGLVQTQGRLLRRSPRPNGLRLTFAHDLGQLDLGESIAVNGVCLTVTSCQPTQFDADASEETVLRSNLTSIPVGGRVHLERALRVGDRFGGHIVSGHVDATAKLAERHQVGDALALRFELPRELVAYIAAKGSVSIDGVSLTINEVTSSDFCVMVVPHTQRATHLGSLEPGHRVNVEVDVLARYVVHLARVGNALEHPAADRADRDASLTDAMKRAGML